MRPFSVQRSAFSVRKSKRWGPRRRTPNSERPTLRAECGFSLLEVLVASTLLAVAVIGTGYFFVSGQAAVEDAGVARGGLHAAQSKLAELQGLPLPHADLQGTPSPGKIHLDPLNPIVLDDRGTPDGSDDIKGYRRWVVTDVDDPANGTSKGAVDYKAVQVDVAEDATFSTSGVLATLKTILAR